MAKTFSEFAYECINYGHSQENYDIMKESAELSLMNQYIENQQFNAENSAMLESYEGFFTESTSENNIQILTESFAEKAKSLGKKIANGFKKLLDTVIKFFKNIVAKLTNNENGVKDLFKCLENAKYSPELLNDLGNELKMAAASAKLSLRENQPFTKVSKFGTINAALIRYYAAALSWDKVALDRNNRGVVDADCLAKIMEKWVAAEKGYDYAAVEKLVQGAHAAALDKGVIVKACVADIQKVVDRLEACKVEFEEFYNKEFNINDDAEMVFNEMNDSLDLIRRTIGNTIVQYGAFVAYRTKAADIIKKFCEENKPAAEQK